MDQYKMLNDKVDSAVNNQLARVLRNINNFFSQNPKEKKYIGQLGIQSDNNQIVMDRVILELKKHYPNTNTYINEMYRVVFEITIN